MLKMRDIPDVKELLKWEGCPRLLIYLYFKKKGHITKMVEEIGGSSGALYNALPILRKYDLITEDVPKQVYRKGAKRKEECSQCEHSCCWWWRLDWCAST